MSNHQIFKHNDNLSLPAQKKESGELSILFRFRPNMLHFVKILPF